MHVLVLGAGVVGVTTAYYLSQLGCEVTVVDRASEPGDGATFGNAGQLSYSFTDALAKPGFVPHLPAMLLGRDMGSKVRLSPKLVQWGVRFLTQCTASRARENTLSVLRLAMRSAGLISQLQEHVPLDFHYRTAGKLVLLSSEAELEAARATTELKHKNGCDAVVLTRDEAETVEPALADMDDEFIAAVYSSSDEVADSQLFTAGLKSWLETHGAAEFRLSTEAKDLLVRDGHVRGVRIDGNQIDADAVVVCLGAWSGDILRDVGVDPHIVPARGYSITLPPGPCAPEVSVTALKHKMVFSRLDGFVRVAGFVDFTGFDTSADDVRTAQLQEAAKRCAPRVADYDSGEAQVWGGFRPMTPSGRPRVGATTVPGLYVNVGHGMLGWTLACATAYDAAQAVTAVH
jgi:D-amino-acid dehydrogenase